MPDNHEPLIGREVDAAEGPYEGLPLVVIGPDWLFPGSDRFIVEAPDGKQWGVDGAELRRILNPK